MKHCSACGLDKHESEFSKHCRTKDGLQHACKSCYRKILLKRNYGITSEHVDHMYAAQGGNCAICGDHLTNPNVDHCHTTGDVRGLLCPNCNKGLGLFRDCTNRLQSAIKYLLK